MNREQLLEMSDARVEKVILPGGGEAFVRTLTAVELDEWERSLTLPVRFKDKGIRRTTNVMSRYVAMVCCDESGKRTFSDGDAPAIGRMRADVVKAIFDAGQALNNADEIADDAEKN